MAVTRGEDVRARPDPIKRLTLQKKPATDGEAACWRVEKQGVSARAGGMIIGNGLQRTAVEGVGADLRRRTCESVGLGLAPGPSHDISEPPIGSLGVT